ncbi:MAG: DUF3857 domain-containing protein [candidate division Zixibacteria bacterium]|nr:DUF3857 domain-containing protein [candidate division Zixibacteria bacterium]
MFLTKIIRSLIVCVVLLIFSIPLSTYGLDKWGKVGASEWITSAPIDYPEANAIVLFEHGFVGITKDKDDKWEFSFHKHIRELVLTQAGVDEVSQAEIAFNSNKDDPRIENIKAHTISPDGSVYEVSEDDMYVKKVNDGYVQSFAFPKVDSGYIVEISYKLPKGIIVPTYWYFHNKLYTKESKFVYESIEGTKYIYVTSNIPPIKRSPACRTHKDTLGFNEVEVTVQSYSWLLKNLPPIKAEPYMTCVEDYQSAVHITPKYSEEFWNVENIAESWGKLGYYFEEFGIEDYLQKPRKFRKYVHKATKGCKTDYEKSKTIYEYVTNNFEIIQSDNLIIHDDLAEMWKEKNGTPAEKNLMLLEMLRAARIDAWIVLLCTRNSARFNPRWLGYNQFNHIIVFTEVEQGGIYLDATSKYCPYGTLPPVCHVETGLLVHSDKSELVKIITKDLNSDRYDYTQIWISPDGSAACTTKTMTRGYPAVSYGQYYEQHEPDEFIEYLLDEDEKVELKSHSVELDSTGRFTIETVYNIEGLIREIEGNFLVEVPNFQFDSNPFKSARRFFPVDFGFPFGYHNTVNIHVNDSNMSVILPEDIVLDGNGLKYVRQSRSIGNAVTVESKLSINRPLFNVDEYDRIRKFFKRVEKTTDDPVQFVTEEM